MTEMKTRAFKLSLKKFKPRSISIKSTILFSPSLDFWVSALGIFQLFITVYDGKLAEILK